MGHGLRSFSVLELQNVLHKPSKLDSSSTYASSPLTTLIAKIKFQWHKIRNSPMK